MDEFIENFEEFRDWLNSWEPSDAYEKADALGIIRDKFEELGLNDAF